MKLIDVDELLEALRKSYKYHAENSRELSLLQRDINIVKEQPTVDAVPVRHGKWIDEGQYADFFPHHAYRCSECGHHLLEIEVVYDFCPFCGAKMDERKE